MNQNCSACNITIDENNYLKHRTISKNCHKEITRKNYNKTTIENDTVATHQQQKMVILTIKTPLIQKMKIMPMLLLAQETLAKLITFSKYLKK